MHTLLCVVLIFGLDDFRFDSFILSVFHDLYLFIITSLDDDHLT